MKTDPKLHFGGWLKQRRKALDLTQTELADQVGCAEVTIRKIESGGTRPSKQLTERLADALLIASEERLSFIAFARRATNKLPTLPERKPPVHNLPVQAMPFVGRTQELTAIDQMLAKPECRLLTLIGPGGIGKTRLALEAATQQMQNFAQGVCFVALAPVGSPELLATTIIESLKISGSAEPKTHLVNYLRDRQMLLVIDNCEHLLAGIDLLADILSNALGVKILTTSRERLNLQEEWTLPIEGLAYPDEKSPDADNTFSAIQLFTERALRVRPDFVLADNLDAVIDICRAVEGMPLGIELAASGLRAMSCSQLAAQINQDLDVLTTPIRNVPERHRSLRTVFDHSWKLLSDAEQQVLATLSVFRGGFDIEAAEQVAEATLPLLVGLVDKSLIRLQPSGRYSLHEQLRQYAALKLTAEVAAKRRHFDYFLSLAERAEPLLLGGISQNSWLDRLEDEEHNYRAALVWSFEQDEAELSLRMVATLGLFWRSRHRYREGYQWLMAALAKPSDAPALIRCKALLHACHIARYYPGNISHSIALGEEALALAHVADYPQAVAYALVDLGYTLALDHEKRQTSLEMLEESVRLFRTFQDKGGLLTALEALGVALATLGNFERAISVQTEGRALAREHHYQFMEGWLLLGLAWSTSMLGDLKHAVAYSHEGLCVFQAANEHKGQAFAILQFGDLAWLDGDYGLAQTYYFESLYFLKEMNFDWDIAGMLDRLVALAVVRQCPLQAAKLLGAVTAYNQAAGRVNFEGPPEFNPNLATVREQIGEKAFAIAYEEGQRMTIQQATAYALQELA